MRRRVVASEHFAGWAFVTPGVAIILLFGAVPLAWSAIMSFQRSNLLSPSTPFVGLKIVPGTMIVGLFLAVAMNRKIRFISFYRTAAHATGSLPPGLPAGSYATLIAMLAAAGVPAVLDAHGAALPAGAAAGPAIVKPNLAELEAVAGRRLSAGDGAD